LAAISRAALDEEGGHGPLGVFDALDFAINEEQVGPLGPGDETLLSADIEHIAFAAGFGRRAEEVRPTARFRQPFGHGEFACSMGLR